jgi:hypothetical protein
MRRARIAIVAGVALAVVPSAARAASVAVVETGIVEYRAAPGEANDVAVLSTSATTVRVEDAGATVTPGAGCVSAGPHAASCTAVAVGEELPIRVRVSAGDMDDVVESHGPDLAADGGAGADVLRGGPNSNGLMGGEGDDHLYGGDADDALLDGPGNDRLSAGRGADTLFGGAGDDRLLGGRGSDRLDGGEGRDLLRGGTNHDVLVSGSASCGHGYDWVYPSVERDLVRRDCELARWQLPTGAYYDEDGVDMRPYPVERRDTSLTFAGWCPEGDAGPLPIRGAVNLTAAGRLIGEAALARVTARCGADRDKLHPHSRFRIRVGLNRTGRRLLADDRPTDIAVAFAGHNVPLFPWSITLR